MFCNEIKYVTIYLERENYVQCNSYLAMYESALKYVSIAMRCKENYEQVR